jgi:transglutaminase-like putative cysteine protease
MNWLKENKIGIIIIYVNLIFIMRLMRLAYRIKSFNYMQVTFIFLVGAAIFWLFNGLLEKLRYKYALFLSALSAGIIFLYKRAQVIIDFFFGTIVSNFEEINELLYSGSNTTFALFRPYIVILLPIITIILLHLYVKGITEAVLVINLAVMLMFWFLDYHIEVKSNIPIFILLCVLSYTYNNYIKNMRELNKKGIHIFVEKKRIVTYIIAYSIIIALTVLMLPQEISGRYGRYALSRWTNPFAPEARWLSGGAIEGKYGLARSGYSNTDTILGGPIVIDRTLAFRVKADGSYYLKGDVKDHYDGFSWRKTSERYKRGHQFSGTELNKFISGIQALTSDDFKKQIEIHPERLHVNTIFAPSNVISIDMSRGRAYFDDRSWTFMSNNAQTNMYSISFYDPDGVEQLISETIGYNKNYPTYNFDPQYLQVPDNVSERTRELVKNITRYAYSDEEKVERIMEYLTREYNYALEVPFLPEGQEFLDFFLFQDKQGYCVYFATAMTIMCRIAGIAARYVEGFKMPAGKVGEFYNVTNEQAHAWTEILVQAEPEVWVVRDTSPTPAEDRARRAGENPGQTPTDPTVQPPTEEPIPTPPSQDNEYSPDDVDPWRGSEDAPAKNFFLAATLITILAPLITKIIIFRKKIRRMLSAKSCIPIYTYTLKRLKVVGITKSQIETDMEFSSNIYDDGLRTTMTDLVQRVYDEFYGNIFDESLDKQNIYVTIENYVKQRENKIIYNIRKYFM